jgi:hypothetical protein
MPVIMRATGNAWQRRMVGLTPKLGGMVTLAVSDCLKCSHITKLELAVCFRRVDDAYQGYHAPPMNRPLISGSVQR